MLMFLLTTASAWAFDPPRIMGVISARPNRDNFALDFCCIGDQNGDGYDDLIVNEYAFANQPPSRVYLFHGGDTIPDDNAFVYTSYEAGLTIGRGVFYFDRMLGGGNSPIVGICSMIRYQSSRIDLYELGADLENSPLATLTIHESPTYPWLEGGYRNRSLDFNGDGFYEGSMLRIGIGFMVYYGGEELDTIPDWSVPILSARWSGGLDVNGDDIGDILMYTTENDTSWYSLYLGGNPPDTIPAVRIRAIDYDLTENFAMLPDVNGDRFDEWGIYWNRGIESGGFHIFLGGEEPDGVPDVNLEGTRNMWKEEGKIAGGDFNADGFGDIVTTTYGGPDGGEYSEMMIHFGNRWFRNDQEEHRADIYLDMSNVYGGIYPLYVGNLGAVGDYNGDHVQDYCWGGSSRRVLIFAGNRNWQLKVPGEPTSPIQFTLSMRISPNPFNNSIQIQYSVSEASNIKLEIFDVTGRQVALFDESKRGPEAVSLEWHTENSGVFLVVLSSTNPTSEPKRIIKKIVCIR